MSPVHCAQQQELPGVVDGATGTPGVHAKPFEPTSVAHVLESEVLSGKWVQIACLAEGCLVCSYRQRLIVVRGFSPSIAQDVVLGNRERILPRRLLGF